MRVIKVLRGYSCWKIGMTPIPDIQGYLVQENDLVVFCHKGDFTPSGADSLVEFDKNDACATLRSEADYLIHDLPRFTQRDKNARNRYFNHIFKYASR